MSSTLLQAKCHNGEGESVVNGLSQSVQSKTREHSGEGDLMHAYSNSAAIPYLLSL